MDARCGEGVVTRAKPCPFCGVVGRSLDRHFMRDGLPVIACLNCGACGPTIQPGVDSDGNYNRAEAARAWNTRAQARQA